MLYYERLYPPFYSLLFRTNMLETCTDYLMKYYIIRYMKYIWTD